jgi:hypothetical protein
MSVIETLTFRLAAGADEADFLRADARMQVEVCYRSAGLLRRTTARCADGEWLVLTLWRSQADADAAHEGVRGHAATGAFRACIDVESMRTARYDTLD